ncbi:hypothetical protein ACFX14_007679 [Malus domestica]
MGYRCGFNVSPIVTAGGGGLSLWWEDCWEVNIILSTKNIIHLEMQLKGRDDWFLVSWMYRNPYRAEKDTFWNWAMETFIPSSRPWFCRRGGLQRVSVRS